MKKIYLGTLVIIAILIGTLLVLLNTSPSLHGWQTAQTQTRAKPGQVRVTYLGTATLLISDGKTRLLTDGYFSRAGLGKVLFGKLAPDAARIDRSLKQAGITHVDDIMVLHSHFDHAMDSAEVAKRTGARLLGSASTVMVARGAHLPAARITRVTPGKPYHFGDFTVTFVPARHVPLPAPVEALTGKGEITRPLVPPAPVGAWQEGQCYALVIHHPNGSLLVVGSAGYVPGALQGYQADYAFIASASLGKQSTAYQQAFFDNTVKAVGADTVIPVHWDNFFTELSPRVQPLPWLLDNMGASFHALADRLHGNFLVLPPLKTLILNSPTADAAAQDERQSPPATPAS
ncbi:MAG: MBL fold metallo-hydrolase [Alcanivorax sp.]|nr:MBL fold metallo-hydrolase [Alcanivorax sp.]